jgi:hypothetical protein
MLTPAMLRRLLITVTVLSLTTFFAAEGFAMANNTSISHSKPNLSTPSGWVLG